MLVIGGLAAALGLLSQRYAKPQERRSPSKVFLFAGYRFWELEERGKALRLAAVVLLVVAVLLSMYWAGVFHPPDGSVA